MSDASRTALWARVCVDELVRLGVRTVCLAPGSRSTPLVLAAARRTELTLRAHLDERSAGFFALGHGKATGRPAAVVTTSGTAVANLLPAVTEAFYSEAPMLVLSADRPRRLRGSDANQTIDQVGLFGGMVRGFADVGPASERMADLRHLRRLLCRAVADSIGRPAGPVHLNIPFDKPLEPTLRPDGTAPPAPDPIDRRAAESAPETEGPTLGVSRRVGTMASEIRDQLVESLDEAVRGVILVGPVPDPADVGDAAVRLAAATGFPLLADPLSGARWRAHHGATVLGAYDLFLESERVRRALRPDIVLRVGQAPTSAHALRWLDEHREVRQIVIDPGHRWKDHRSTASDYVRADPALAMMALAEGARRHASGRWRTAWSALEERTRAVVDGSDSFDPGHEGWIVAETLARVPLGASLFVSSSMPVRDLDAFGPPANREGLVLARGNRGASGIDGIVSTALGVASGTGRPVVAALGDVAFLHDLNGLLAARDAGPPIVFVVINNDGGGIFHMLPVRAHEPHFTPYVATPHGLDFEHAARLFGISYARVEGAKLAAAIDRALEDGGAAIVEIRTDREHNARAHGALRAEIREAVEAVEPYEPSEPGGAA